MITALLDTANLEAPNLCTAVRQRGAKREFPKIGKKKVYVETNTECLAELLVQKPRSNKLCAKFLLKL